MVTNYNKNTNATNPRQINNIKIKLSNNTVTDIAVTVTGGSTTGAHVARWDMDGGDMCDCIGFSAHQKCRHIDLVTEIGNSVSAIVGKFN